MSEEKTLKARVAHKHKTEAKWREDVYDATTGEKRSDPFIPLNGELIIFDADENYDYKRFKFGDGHTNVIDLPFASNSLFEKGEEEGAIQQRGNQVIGENSFAVGKSNQVVSNFSSAEGESNEVSSLLVTMEVTCRVDINNKLISLMSSERNDSFLNKDCFIELDGEVYNLKITEIHEYDDGSAFYYDFQSGQDIVAIEGQIAGLSYRPLIFWNHIEGYKNRIKANYSHAEGYNNKTNANAGHAEGHTTETFGAASHAEGYLTKTHGNHSHAEGEGSQTGKEGQGTNSGKGAHAEGYSTKAIGQYSHSEGYVTQSIGKASHAEGSSTIAEGTYSHASGQQTEAKGAQSCACGYFTIASGQAQMAIGMANTEINNALFIVGNGKISGGQVTERSNAFYVTKNGAFAGNGSPYITKETTDSLSTEIEELNEQISSIKLSQSYWAIEDNRIKPVQTSLVFDLGENSQITSTSTSAKYALVHGIGNTIKAGYTHAEGESTQAIGTASHSEGWGTQAVSPRAHAEGVYTRAGVIDTDFTNYSLPSETTGIGAHAEGHHAIAFGFGSHAEGHGTQAIYECSHAEGLYTKTGAKYQTVCGHYNAISTDGLFVVGCGENNLNRENAFVVGKDFIKAFGKNIITAHNNTLKYINIVENLPTSPSANTLYFVLEGQS